jgi:hypothetical protein
MLGDAHTPPHIQVERAQLRAELGIVESVIGWSRARPSIGDELGPNGRFLAYMAESKRGNTEAHRASAEARRANDGIAMLGERLDGVLDELKMHRQFFLLIGIVVVVILVAGAVIVTYVLTRGV